MQHQVGFLGGGAMCNAIVRGVLNAKLLLPKDVYVYDPSETQLKPFIDLGCRTASSESDLVRAATVIVLAVKPDVVVPVLCSVKADVTADKVFVSVAAGVSLASIEGALPAKSRVVRVMPNTPCLISQGASVVSPGSAATPADVDFVKQMFSAVGLALVADEKYLDGVTGLSGSGPAYVFQFIEALADGGVRAGLPRDMAMQLAVQLVKGSAQMVQETKSHPAELKDKVTSPGGTTIVGVHALENGGLRGTVMSAVLAATQRARELGAMPSGKL